MLRRRGGLLLMVSGLMALAAGCGNTMIPGGKPGGGGSPNPTKSDPVIAWAAPAAITNPAPLTSAQLDATANVAGSFVYSPAAGTVLTPGTQTLSTTFTPADTADYNTATASVTITVNPAVSTASSCGSGGAGNAVAYVYLPAGTQSDPEILGYAATADGGLTPIPGSPFATSSSYAVSTMVGTGSLLFGSDGYHIETFAVQGNGCISPENSMVAGVGDGADATLVVNGLFLDPQDENLYSFDYNPPDGLDGKLASYSFDRGSGQVTQIGTDAVGGNGTLSFGANDAYAVDTYCNARGGTFVNEYQRGSSGALIYLKVLPYPAAGPDQPWCPGGTAADGSGHFVIEFTPFVYAGATSGPTQLAVYTVDAAGNVTTASTSRNMTDVPVSDGESVLEFSPDDRYLAVDGAFGIELFAWNSASTTLTPITTINSGYSCWSNNTGSGCGGWTIGMVGWDENDHLYAVFQNQLRVYNISDSGMTQAPGSPYPVQNAFEGVVLPRTAN